eukprot:m.29875 g.29875  ORF g.29875 m.29875 type:complete len:176 (-) comp6187_c0_seq3:2178-2705(-)
MHSSVLASYVLEEDFEGENFEDLFEYIGNPHNLRDFAQQIESINILEDITHPENHNNDNSKHASREIKVSIIDKIHILYCIPKTVVLHATCIHYPNGCDSDELDHIKHPFILFHSTSSGVTVRHKYIFQPTDGGFKLIDQVEFFSFPFMLKQFVLKTARNAHEHTMQVIKEKWSS